MEFQVQDPPSEWRDYLKKLGLIPPQNWTTFDGVIPVAVLSNLAPISAIQQTIVPATHLFNTVANPGANAQLLTTGALEAGTYDFLLYSGIASNQTAVFLRLLIVFEDATGASLGQWNLLAPPGAATATQGPFWLALDVPQNGRVRAINVNAVTNAILTASISFKKR